MLISTWIIGRPKKNSKRRMKGVSCKIRVVESSTPARINCRLGNSGGRLVSLSWQGIVHRMKYDCERRLEFLGPDRFWLAFSRQCKSHGIASFSSDRTAFPFFGERHRKRSTRNNKDKAGRR